MAQDMFLKLSGIAGESQDARHKGEIEIIGWSWGVSETPAAPGGGGAGKPHFHTLSLQKLVDLASAPLLAAAAKGSRISSATLAIRRAGAAPQEFLAIALKDVVVASVAMTDSETASGPAETVALAFGRIDFEYTQFLPSGAKGATKAFKWDIANNRPL